MTPRTALAALLACAAVPAAAQTGTQCQGRAVLDAVYQVGLAGGRYEYFLMLRNATAQRLVAEIAFSGFPANVQLFSASLPGVVLAPRATQSIRFGTGTNGNINLGTVQRVTDAAAASGATIRLRGCRAG